MYNITSVASVHYLMPKIATSVGSLNCVFYPIACTLYTHLLPIACQMDGGLQIEVEARGPLDFSFGAYCAASQP